MLRAQIYQSHSRFDLVEPDGGTADSGVMFRRIVQLPAGHHGFLVQLQTDPSALPQIVSLDIEVVDLLSGDRIGGLSLTASESEISLQRLDSLVFGTRSSLATCVAITGRVTGALGRVMLRHLVINRSDAVPPKREDFFDDIARLNTRVLKSIFVGSTNICSANCPHCPTNKKMTAHLEQGVMSDEVFERLLDGLATIDLADGLMFGLFGEPFDDPRLETRIRRLRERFPDIPVNVATNAGSADVDRMMSIVKDIRTLAIHVEAVTAATYDKLMVPLKAAEVLPRVDAMVRAAPHKVSITTPVHRNNLHELPALVRRWSGFGADFRFSQLQTRVTDLTAARRLALAPAPGFWTWDLLDLIIIDWDGSVLVTCDDFLKRQVLGNLRTTPLADILAGTPRRQAFEALRNYRWTDLPSIYGAVVDDAAALLPNQGELSRPQIHQLGSTRFQTDRSERVSDGLVIRHDQDPDQTPAVFGPYLSLKRGRYVVRFLGELIAGSVMCLQFRVTTQFGQLVLAAEERRGGRDRIEGVALEFTIDSDESSVEFPITALGGLADDGFLFRGVVVYAVEDCLLV
ncbi:hypothetical protein KOAAANKH_01317 [Brevundimonas sp. NIBR10]|uniref:radical SAM protein n=1 Tax=Brevundimonas sp. NIBR10 TaxID=3015997 RepID=UPI0022F18343|nr:radical SAM protein [Brevundimonas sp. NIBR10]WGM46449.1 hypothetical protein KOAAANKH_01317 [Brevundimonas sp. NIBR10]